MVTVKPQDNKRENMFNSTKFLKQNFGTIEGVRAYLTAKNLAPPNAKAVEKWFQRNSTPSNWLTLLIWLKERDMGHAISLEPFMEKADAVAGE